MKEKTLLTEKSCSDEIEVFMCSDLILNSSYMIKNFGPGEIRLNFICFDVKKFFHQKKSDSLVLNYFNFTKIMLLS